MNSDEDNHPYLGYDAFQFCLLCYFMINLNLRFADYCAD